LPTETRGIPKSTPIPTMTPKSKETKAEPTPTPVPATATPESTPRADEGNG
jgi:hypothetical protein